MSEEDEEIGVDTYDDAADEKSPPLEESIEEGFAAQPVEIVRREEIVTVAENPNAETFSEEKVSTIGDTEVDDDDLYKLVKAHSIQLSRLTDIVESLQSQIMQLEETRLSGRKTSSARRSTVKTKKNKGTAKKPKGLVRRNKK